MILELKTECKRNGGSSVFDIREKTKQRRVQMPRKRTPQERGRYGPVRSALPLKGHSPLRRLASPMLLSPSLFPTQNEPPIRASYTLPEFVQKNQDFPIWHNDFGAKNGAQAKRRVEAYLTYARIAVIRSRQKTNLQHERFVYASGVRSKKTKGTRLGAMKTKVCFIRSAARL